VGADRFGRRPTAGASPALRPHTRAPRRDRGRVLFAGPRVPRPGVASLTLTFHDGPAVLVALRVARARATFSLGERRRRPPNVVRRMAAEGHAVRVHADRHAPRTEMTRDEGVAREHALEPGCVA
jgi:hypothetical protein